MKKIKQKLFLFLACILITGCQSVDFEKLYEDSKIGDNVESYQIDLRIYGTLDKEKLNEMYIIDNYKNEEYTINKNKEIYYIVNNAVYKENSNIPTESIFDNSLFEFSLQKEEEDSVVYSPTYEIIEDKIYHSTDILLSGLKNIKSKKRIKNDKISLNLVAYEVKLKDDYIKELLNSLGYDCKYKKVTGRVYLQDDKLYKIVYHVDDLTINATVFRVNEIDKINIDFEENA